MSSSMGVGGRHRVRSLMGSAIHGKGTTVGDGGDGLARSEGRRFSLYLPSEDAEHWRQTPGQTPNGICRQQKGHDRIDDA